MFCVVSAETMPTVHTGRAVFVPTCVRWYCQVREGQSSYHDGSGRARFAHGERQCPPLRGRGDLDLWRSCCCCTACQAGEEQRQSCC